MKRIASGNSVSRLKTFCSDAGSENKEKSESFCLPITSALILFREAAPCGTFVTENLREEFEAPDIS